VNFSTDIFKKRVIEGFVGGNVSSQESLDALNMLQDILPGYACDPKLVEQSKLKPLSGIGRPSMHNFNADVAGNFWFMVGNAVVWNLLIGPKDDALMCGTLILSKLLKEPFYTELRTNQQTGYMVSSGYQIMDNNLFLSAAIQSNTFDARDLLARIELFSQNFLRVINESEDVQPRFESIRTSLIDRLKEPHDSLYSKMQFYNNLAFNEDCDYHMIERRIENLSGYLYDDVKSFADILLVQSHHKKSAVLCSGNSGENKRLSYVEIGTL
jgi:insulysin